MDARLLSGFGIFHNFPLTHLPCMLTMAPQSQQPKKRDGVLLSLDIAINMVNIGKEVASMTPAPAVFGSVTILLTTIRVSSLLFRDEMLRAHTYPG